MSAAATKELHALAVHVFPSEEARLSAEAQGLISPEDLVLTPDTGANVYDQLSAVAGLAGAAAERAGSIAAFLEDAVATNAFQGEPGPRGEQGPKGTGIVADVLSGVLLQDQWVNKQQSLSFPALTPGSGVIVGPDAADFSPYAAAGIRATQLLAGGILFYADTLPPADVGVQIILLY